MANVKGRDGKNKGRIERNQKLPRMIFLSSSLRRFSIDVVFSHWHGEKERELHIQKGEKQQHCENNNFCLYNDTLASSQKAENNFTAISIVKNYRFSSYLFFLFFWILLSLSSSLSFTHSLNVVVVILLFLSKKKKRRKKNWNDKK